MGLKIVTAILAVLIGVASGFFFGSFFPDIPIFSFSVGFGIGFFSIWWIYLIIEKIIKN